MANYLWFGKLHSKLYQLTGGRLGHWMWHRMVLMHTIGAKSGELRDVTVQYYPLHDAGVLVIPSNNGQPKPPAWWFNLKAHPDIAIQLGREHRRVKALIQGKQVITCGDIVVCHC